MNEERRLEGITRKMAFERDLPGLRLITLGGCAGASRPRKASVKRVRRKPTKHCGNIIKDTGIQPELEPVRKSVQVQVALNEPQATSHEGTTQNAAAPCIDRATSPIVAMWIENGYAHGTKGDTSSASSGSYGSDFDDGEVDNKEALQSVHRVSIHRSGSIDMTFASPEGDDAGNKTPASDVNLNSRAVDAAVAKLKIMFEANGMEWPLEKCTDKTGRYVFIDTTLSSRKLRLGVTSAGEAIVETGFGFEDLVKYLSRFEDYNDGDDVSNLIDDDSGGNEDSADEKTSEVDLILDGEKLGFGLDERIGFAESEMSKVDAMDKDTMLVLRQIDQERKAAMDVIRNEYKSEEDFVGPHHEHLVSRSVHMHARAQSIFSSSYTDDDIKVRRSIDKAVASMFSLTERAKITSLKSAESRRKRIVERGALVSDTGRVDAGLPGGSSVETELAAIHDLINSIEVELDRADGSQDDREPGQSTERAEPTSSLASTGKDLFRESTQLASSEYKKPDVLATRIHRARSNCASGHSFISNIQMNLSSCKHDN